MYQQEESKFLKTINSDARPFSNETDKLPETKQGGNFSSEFSLSKPTNTGLSTAHKTASLKQQLINQKKQDERTQLNKSEQMSKLQPLQIKIQQRDSTSKLSHSDLYRKGEHKQDLEDEKSLRRKTLDQEFFTHEKDMKSSTSKRKQSKKQTINVPLTTLGNLNSYAKSPYAGQKNMLSNVLVAHQQLLHQKYSPGAPKIDKRYGKQLEISDRKLGQSSKSTQKLHEINSRDLVGGTTVQQGSMTGQVTNSMSALDQINLRVGQDEEQNIRVNVEMEDIAKRDKEGNEGDHQSSCLMGIPKESGLTKNSTVPLLSVHDANATRESLVQSKMNTNQSSMAQSMNYTSPGSTPEANKSLEKIDSRESSLDSNISGSDTLERIQRKNTRLKIHLQDIIDKAEETINQLHQGIPMEVKMSRKQLQKEVRRVETQLERENEQKNIILLEN